MSKVTVFNKGFELIYSTVLHVTNDEFKLVYDGLSLDVLFKDDGGTGRYSSSIVDGGVVLELFNMSNPLGEGALEPIPFARTSGREVRLSFFVNTVNKETKYRIVTINLFKAPAA